LVVFHSRSAILTLYGDYLRQRSGEISIAGLIVLMGNFGLSGQAVRSAVSRMCRSGFLKVRRLRNGSYYSLTVSGYELLNKGTERIFQRKYDKWDGSWSIVTYSVPEKLREIRDRMRTELGWFGYGALSEATWISPYDMTSEVEALAARLGAKEYIYSFRVRHNGSTRATDIVARCWDLDKIHQQYKTFLHEYQPRYEKYLERTRLGEMIEPNVCFVERFNLIHEYRRLPYLDPDLPEELLPANWLRPQAADLFKVYHDFFAARANAYFDSVFAQSTANTPRKV
jgi:phenylacetic acid degradation operon negative regulatory protein